MCGICGIVNGEDELISTDLLHSMARTMRHRGPDDEGFHIQPGVALGFQRLSIIDLAGGHQPMSSADARYWLVFNGEIYNFQSLRQQLEGTGHHRFQTNSDTEVILHLYQEFGENCVQHLRGMFAFAIWDTQKKTLFAARDRLGKKPFVYATVGSTFLFASELRALLKHPGIHKEIDYGSIDLYLTYQYIPSPRTIFQQIQKLPPAHSLLWEKGEVTVKRYWEPRFLPKTSMSFNEASAQMMAKLREATKLRMISDVPLGAFLSGGKDSSIIVGLMSELSSTPVKTFSIGFEEQDLSELPFARTVAKHFGCDHHEFVVKPDMVELLPKLAWHYSEPFADSSALPSYYVSQITRQHVTVALNGDGGDEAMAGYPRYKAMKFLQIWQKLPIHLRKSLFKLADLVPDGPPPASISWRLKRLLRLGLSDSRSIYSDSLCIFREEQKTPIYSDFMRQTLANQFAPDYLNHILSQGLKYPGLDAYLYADLIAYLPECLMTKMDIASMANSLEARSPFLDHEFLELVAGFPSSWKLRGIHSSKHILTQAANGWLPDSILNRRKQGFAIPMSHWFKGKLKSYVEDTLLSKKALSRNLFRPEGLKMMLNSNLAGKTDYSYQLWTLLMLEHWYKVYIDTPDTLVSS
jgi:asparagine synthase (glutamine-hydrolysing)